MVSVSFVIVNILGFNAHILKINYLFWSQARISIFQVKNNKRYYVLSYSSTSNSNNPLFNFFVTGSYLHSCLHCQSFQTFNLNDILEHCKICPSMPRPNIYKCKYVCYMCPYHAYQVVQMRAHIFSHMGEKPYKCNLCDFSCTLKSNLNKHLRIKHHLDTKNCFP